MSNGQHAIDLQKAIVKAQFDMEMIRIRTGLEAYRTGNPFMSRQIRPNCINCGAPGESICSYCGTAA